MTEPSPAARLIEAVLFAASHPVSEEDLAQRLPEGTELASVLTEIETMYDGRGVTLTKISGKWAFRTAPDLAAALSPEQQVQRKLSRAAVETLAIIAYHQPITRAEVEQVRGVALSKGTLDMLMEATWIKPKGRRQAPGRPVTWVTTDEFLEHFGLDRIEDLPNLDELRAAGLLDHRGGITMAMRQEEADAVEAEAEKERDEEDARTREERRQAQLDDEEDEARGAEAAAEESAAAGDEEPEEDVDEDDDDEDEDLDDEDDEDEDEDEEEDDDEEEDEKDESPPKRSTAE
ncbi:MAG: SMC-Scp complex subunit ScpB [Rhodospirillaceae bacterium]|nr:SMC-Scp complex subunit ScpB [Rhodospirillaceae bacterium]